jgi:hypothetical protein
MQRSKEEILKNLDFVAYYESQLGTKLLMRSDNDSWTSHSKCPFHEEKEGSFGVNVKTGQYRCFGCDEKGDVFKFHIKKNNTSFKDALEFFAPGSTHEKKTTIKHPELGVPFKTYKYKDEKGKELFYVCRFKTATGKEFRPCKPNGSWRVKGSIVVPYNLQKIKDAQTVYLVEGEKDADTLIKADIAATCKANWTGHWDDDFAEKYFSGKDVIIFQDNDVAGDKKTKNALSFLRVYSNKVKIIPPLGDKKGYDVSDFFEEGGTKRQLITIVSREKWAVDNSAKIAPVFSLIPISSMEFKTPDWLIEGLFEKDSISLIFGEPGSYKSFVAIDIACCIGNGIPFHSKKVDGGIVVYLAAEGKGGIKKRFLAWEIKHQLKSKNIYINKDGFNLFDEACVDRLIDTLCGLESLPKLIVFDTLAMSFGIGDENSVKDMNTFISSISKIKEASKCCVLIIHHTGHKNKDRARGSSALHAAMDTEYLLKKNKDDLLEMKCIKMKDHEEPSKLCFQKEIVEIGIDDVYGKACTSLTFSRQEPSPQSLKEDRLISNCLRELGDISSFNRVEKALASLKILYRIHYRNVEDGKTARVLIRDWDIVIKELGLKRDQKSKAKKTLIDKGLVIIEEPYVYLHETK